MGTLAWLCHQNMNHDSTKFASYVTELHQKGTSSYYLITIIDNIIPRACIGYEVIETNMEIRAGEGTKNLAIHRGQGEGVCLLTFFWINPCNMSSQNRDLKGHMFQLQRNKTYNFQHW